MWYIGKKRRKETAVRRLVPGGGKTGGRSGKRVGQAGGEKKKKDTTKTPERSEMETVGQ